MEVMPNHIDIVVGQVLLHHLAVDLQDGSQSRRSHVVPVVQGRTPYQEME